MVSLLHRATIKQYIKIRQSRQTETETENSTANQLDRNSTAQNMMEVLNNSPVITTNAGFLLEHTVSRSVISRTLTIH